MFKDELRGIVKLLGCLDIYLLFPMSVFTGFGLTFIWAEFNRVNFFDYICISASFKRNFFYHRHLSLV
jgi:hypothetical protein